MRKNRIIALSCACVMGVCSLTACSKDSSSSDSSSGSKNGSSTTESYYNAPAVDTGWEWGNVEICGGGFVPNIIYNPPEEGLVYARTDMGGAYRMDKETNRWVCITDCVGGEDWNYNGIESLATDPVEPNRVYLAAGTYTSSNGAIFYSHDYGENWGVYQLPFGCGGNEVGRGAGERLQVDPNDNSIIYFGTRSDGLWKSTNYGKTWEQVAEFPTKGGYSEEGYQIGLTYVAFDKSSSEPGEATKTIIVGAAQTEGDTYIYRSDDAGKTWTGITNPTSKKVGNNTTLKPVQGEISSDGYLYSTWSMNVGPSDARDGAVMKYDLKKGEWTEITPFVDITYTCGYSGISVNPNDPKMIACTTLDLWAVIDNVFVSYDGGESWTGIWDPETEDMNYTIDISNSPWLDWQGQLKPGWWMTGVAINPFNADELMYGTGATIFGTTNLTKCKEEPINLEVRAMGIEQTAIFNFVSPNQNDENAPALYSIMGDLYGFKHQTVDKAPEEHYGDFKCTSIDCAALDYNVVVRATDSGDAHSSLYLSTDAADTWTEIDTLPDNCAKKAGGTVKLSADGKSILYVPGTAGIEPIVSNDQGKTWTACEGLPAGAGIESDKVNPSKFYATYDGNIYMSEDSGKTFTSLTSMLVSNFELKACPDTEGDLWLAMGSAGVYYYNTNEGGTPQLVSKNVTECDVLGIGKAEKDGDYMALYMMGDANDEGYGMYQSTDKGVTWKRINDDTQKWGNVNKVISGDPKTYGRVYVSTNGRGIIMGNIKK